MIIVTREGNHLRRKILQKISFHASVCSMTSEQSPSLKWIFQPLRNLPSKSLILPGMSNETNAPFFWYFSLSFFFFFFFQRATLKALRYRIADRVLNNRRDRMMAVPSPCYPTTITTRWNDNTPNKINGKRFEHFNIYFNGNYHRHCRWNLFRDVRFRIHRRITGSLKSSFFYHFRLFLIRREEKSFSAIVRVCHFLSLFLLFSSIHLQKGFKKKSQ